MACLLELVKTDMLVNNYYTPFIKSKLDNKDINYEKELRELDKQLDRIKSVLRLIVLSDAKRYNDKTLRLGVITLDMESAVLSRIGKTKEATNELCHI